MARLEADHGHWLELRPVKYQFIPPVGDRHDDNWLTIEFAADLGGEVRVRRCWEPALLTWELHGFASRLQQLLAGGRQLARLDPLEPNIAIDATLEDAETAKVRIGLALSFAPFLREPYDEPFWTTVSVPIPSVRRFAGELATELLAFPVRGH